VATAQESRRTKASKTSDPLVDAFGLLGRRWALRLLWELRGGPVGARALRGRTDDISSSVLYTRLGELVTAGLVRQDRVLDYELTPLGRDLVKAIAPLEQWSKRWSRTRGLRSR
jgi:DNA-binding HxlR family transcriptional regulator